MKKMFTNALREMIIFILSLRYKVRVKGLECVTAEKNDPEGGILFLPNHPTILVDPTIITTTILRKIWVRPVIVDFMYYVPFVHFILNLINGVPIPSFSNTTNTHKMRRMDKALSIVSEGLDAGENFLFYPSGKIKLTSKEQIGGASGLYKILKDTKHYNIILVRITGLWGSSFSRINPNRHPVMGESAWAGVKHTLKNLIFFNPRRDVLVEFVKAPPDFPYFETRTVQNRWLENWYNKTDDFKDPAASSGEPLVLVPYSRWSKALPKIEEPENLDVEVDLENVPAQTRQKIIAKLSEMTDIPAKNIHPGMSLASDLGIDSLDAAEIAIFLEEQFDLKDIPGDDLTTVKKVLGVASKQINIERPEEMTINFSKWKIPKLPKEVQLASGNTLDEVFLRTTDRLLDQTACGDQSGVSTFLDLKLRVLVLAEKIKKTPGDYVGILLPASSYAMILVFAVQLAGKIPVMINWTLGARHINAVIEATNLKVCLSSWAFLDRLSNVDLGKLVECLIQLEDLKTEIKLKDRIKAWILSRKGSKALLKHYNFHKKSEDDIAVILFTSGSEGAPKGVPLTHKNVLSNIRSVTQSVKLYENDVFFSMLPPFHSFGFTVCGMAPLLLGIKAVFFPNPTESAKIAKAIEKWKATIICGAPTFLKNIFKSSTNDQLKSARLVVTGAEKASEELFQQAEKLGLGKLVEGYGITECSPVLTINRPDEERKGVGRAVPQVEIVIIDPETYEKIGLNKQGLILAHGPNVFSGYLNRTIDPFVKRDGKNWYITGDLGILDDQGRLTITGRIKRFVKVGPEMISLGSIEEVINSQKDKLVDFSDDGPIVACCAKEIPSEKPKFYLFTTFPMTVEKANVILKQAGFSNLVRIHYVHQLHKMPVMGSGKINYQQLERELMS